MAGHLNRIGQQIGDYRLMHWLGRGSFGDVYLAQHVRDYSQVALKLLHIQLSNNKELKAFINEARTIRLQHAHIVPLLDFGLSREELPFLVMEYASQGTLSDSHPKGSQVPLPLAVNYARQVGSALQYAHERLLIHRDVKPQNMLVRADGTVLLSDFGLVTIAHSSNSLSSQEGIGGTISYMAPEQILGQAQVTSDQYSLGVVVYEWITGQLPFVGTTPEVGLQHMMKPPPSLIAQVPGLSRAVEQVVLKALAKDPKERFVRVQDFTTALEEAARETSALLDKYKTAPVDNDELVLSPDRKNFQISPFRKRPAPGPRAPAATPRAPAATPRVDWDEALVVPIFYGRAEEQAKLTQWIVQERCRVVSVLGMGGIGKSALSVSTIHQLSVGTEVGPGWPPPGPSPFEVIIFRSLRDAPALEVLLDDCLQVLSPQPLSPGPDTLEQRLSLLLSHFRKTRVLMVLDNLECLLEAGDVGGHFRPGFEGYGQLLLRVSQTGHQSCLLFTSREKPAALRLLESRYPQIHSLRLAALDVAACKQILEEKKMRGTSHEQERLIEAYSGNPLALKIVTETIIDLFGGEIGPFLAEGSLVFGNITDLLEEQFVRLSALEQSVLCWLAIAREPITLNELQAVLVSPPSRGRVLEAIDSLRRRSLIEPGKRAGSFTLQSVVLEYVTAVLVAEGSREIQQHRLARLIHHGLSQATAREYVRQTQERLLLSPLLADLQCVYREKAELEQQLLGQLNDLRELDDSAQGYGPANLILLLRLLRGNLNGLDLSMLSIRSAYLQGTEMQKASLAGSLIRDTALTEAVNATWVVAISPDSRWWAAGSMQGKVRVWEEGSPTLRLVWQAHGDMVYTLAFSPDGRTLASGSYDGTVKLWDLGAIPSGEYGDHNGSVVLRIPLSDSHGTSPRGALLWTGWQKAPQSLAFSPDGSLLACGGDDATIQLWDTSHRHGVGPHGTTLQTLSLPSSVFAVAFSPDGQWLVGGCLGGEMCLFHRPQSESSTWVKFLSRQTNWITGLAFAPDGRTLASAHRDPMVIRLWEVGSLHLLHTLPGLQARRVAWSPDGRTLACSGGDKTIWLWDVQQGRIRSALHGHTADVYSLAFAPDNSRLLSSSADGTLRVWHVESCQCTSIIAGYGVTLLDLDWSPDDTHLVSGGTDTLVTIWSVSAQTPPSVLAGHDWIVDGVGWSPDGRLVASCGWDRTVRLWDATSHTAIHSFEGQAMALCVAWSPDGNLLACGTLGRGMQVWDVGTRHLRWVKPPYQTGFSDVAWSPDGLQLASSNHDSNVYLWKTSDGTLLHQLSGHHGWVFRGVWSPDGTQLASGSGGEGSGELFIWDVQSGERLRAFPGHFGQIYALVWSPSGDQLISGDSDGLLRWWDVATGECVSMQAAHQGAIRSLRISHDGRRLASCGDDEGAIRIWDLDSHKLLRTLRHGRPYEQLNITGVRGLNEAEITSLQALGAIEHDSFDPKP